MFDWLKNLRKSAAEKEQEAITAYLDGVMSDQESVAFERRLRDDVDLQAEVESQRSIKTLMSRAPRLRAPRNFVLDPAVYGRQKPASVPLTARLYPQLRAATLVASLVFAVMLTLNLVGPGGRAQVSQDVAMAPAPQAESADVASEVMVEESPVINEVQVQATFAIEEEAEEFAEEALAEAVPEPPAETDDTVELELSVEDEAQATLEPVLTAQPGVTMSGAAADDGSMDEAAADASVGEAETELAAPRATPTADTSRAVIEESDTSELPPTPEPLPTQTVERTPASPEAADDAVAQVQEQTGEETAAGQSEPPAGAPWGWLAALTGTLAVVLLGVTLWARRQASRL